MDSVLPAKVPLRTCPHCSLAGGRFLPHTSKAAIVDYYRCDDCGHVWAADKESLKDQERRTD
jgi:DNA-directed RNA polymerase subunit RPC12/RpoP